MASSPVPMSECSHTYSLRSMSHLSQRGEMETDVEEEIEEEYSDLTFSFSIDYEDYKGSSLDDAIQDHMNLPKIDWPNDIYRSFMEIVTEYRLSNACGDRIIKWFNASTEFQESPLSASTKKGREFLENLNFSHLLFKEIPITTFQGIEYTLHYHPIIQSIKALLLQPGLTADFAIKYREKMQFNDGKILQEYGEQFESDWWWEEEMNIPMDNQLLSIILYADSTTCDHLGKSSEHPIYLSLGNIPNWRCNKPDAKVLLGYLPKLKAKDVDIRNSMTFRKLQREVFQRCLRILLTPILNRENMFFIVNTQIYAFTPKISVILADMAEVGAFTITYLPSTTKRPCCNCLVMREDLNNMSLSSIISRTSENMKNAIDTG